MITGIREVVIGDGAQRDVDTETTGVLRCSCRYTFGGGVFHGEDRYSWAVQLVNVDSDSAKAGTVGSRVLVTPVTVSEALEADEIKAVSPGSGKSSLAELGAIIFEVLSALFNVCDESD